MAHADKRLARRMLRGEERAFSEFFERYGPAIYRFAVTRLGRDAGHAEELTQLTLTRAVTKLDTYQGMASLFSWLCTFCRHEVSAFYERRSRRVEEVELEAPSREVRARLEAEARVRGDDPEAVLGRQELADQVHAALSDLTPPYGDVLEWKYIDGMSAREIADRLGLSVRAAESLLTRARKAFRRRFRRHRVTAPRPSRASLGDVS